jgi:ketosteroid isomerase-like protein
MSEENLERLRQVTDAFNRRDLAAFLSCCDPNVEIVSSRVLIGAPTYRGREAVERFFRDMAVAWEELRVEPRDILPAGPEAFVVVAEASGKGKTSRASLESRRAAHIELSQGKAQRCEFFASEQDALEAAGLSE